MALVAKDTGLAVAVSAAVVRARAVVGMAPERVEVGNDRVDCVCEECVSEECGNGGSDNVHATTRG
eukprot:3259037-Prymnesium_polylepis.1